MQDKMDFVGQGLAANFLHSLLIVSGVLAVVAGFVLQDLFVTAAILVAGTLITALVTVPSWPMYCRHPVTFLPKVTLHEPAESEIEEVAEKTIWSRILGLLV
ncbi:microsomal signal peptidase 12 kDa subunit-domain-containing protein [Fimicolochytrium jonesii]|uniref:microsomal signal peptidase 12 kDa subunit-domain-containing protein n=1 Tax=Fimicolochytrium jonesii TaxID=1396493 RepID=UPI0022FE1916|nr:microsomal signal peptidase 12 kDa subunit-domain-containing protein [Fimicolochytrium jonesii]KAI8823630.1 microsomal signal peptidase 12 kDa subunit-domain-containing protein [Fimicolochytrium jonesii]